MTRPVTLADIREVVGIFDVRPDSVRITVNGVDPAVPSVYRDTDGMIVVDLSEFGGADDGD